MEALGSSQVYFQPPSNIEMEYPAIVYQRDSAITQFAGNRPYKFDKRYQVTVITDDPDSEIVDRVAQLPQCIFDRQFTAENLYHDVFTIYF